jgi:hypothetical protein
VFRLRAQCTPVCAHEGVIEYTHARTHISVHFNWHKGTSRHRAHSGVTHVRSEAHIPGINISTTTPSVLLRRPGPRRELREANTWQGGMSGRGFTSAVSLKSHPIRPFLTRRSALKQGFCPFALWRAAAFPTNSFIEVASQPSCSCLRGIPTFSHASLALRPPTLPRSLTNTSTPSAEVFFVGIVVRKDLFRRGNFSSSGDEQRREERIHRMQHRMPRNVPVLAALCWPWRAAGSFVAARRQCPSA